MKTIEWSHVDRRVRALAAEEAMGHPRREPKASTASHLPAHVQPRGDWDLVVHGTCCWEDANGDFWRIDVVDGVAVTWCNSPCQEVPF